ncbi:EF_hand domain-containing protein [Hexamita inflata]|uniref:EF hand domain-containing protein n=1 Tax=Hexamita inflata TaxID=28002 RepID=A0AA86TM40_9EUKA|nr:EF hand domain-containing protein [Hexamita inflata]CAI9956812.1 EF hand domain-containing protein [Hexamita inflata]
MNNINANNLDIHDIKAMIDIIDPNSDGYLDLQQFVQFKYVLHTANPKDTSSILFYAADTNFSGKIDKKELKIIFQKLNVEISDFELIQIFAMVADKSGEITFDGFKQISTLIRE